MKELSRLTTLPTEALAGAEPQSATTVEPQAEMADVETPPQMEASFYKQCLPYRVANDQIIAKFQTLHSQFACELGPHSLHGTPGPTPSLPPSLPWFLKVGFAHLLLTAALNHHGKLAWPHCVQQGAHAGCLFGPAATHLCFAGKRLQHAAGAVPLCHQGTKLWRFVAESWHIN